MRQPMLLVLPLYLLSIHVKAQVNPSNTVSDSTKVGYRTEQVKTARTTNIPKSVRINVHFMLKSDSTGNFRETDDGDGRSTYNGYLYAYDLTHWLNDNSSQNEQMNIPKGNTTPALAKNYSFKLDAVYFWYNDTSYNFRTIDYHQQGRDRDSVLNIFLSFSPTNERPGGYASNISSTSKPKYTENMAYWQDYIYKIAKSEPMDWFLHASSNNTAHEIGHLFGLRHTVLYGGHNYCPTNCPDNGGYIDTNCDDGCSDTPTAWEIMEANGCTKHPQCGWTSGVDCSNNLMDYTGHLALTPCQIDIIHSSLESGMRSYLTCEAVAKDLSLCDIGYPKAGYFGKNIRIGCTSTMANVTNKEKIKVYFSNSVELSNFEMSADSELEIIEEEVCSF